MTDLPKEMKALRVEKRGDKEYKLTTLPVPKPTGYEALVKIGAAGLCHTDLLVMSGEFGDQYPITGSHEPAGTVVALGELAEKQGKAKVGSRVAGLLPLAPCGACSDCKFGDWKYCPNSKYTGIHVDGAFAEYEILDSRHLVELSDDMTFEQAAPLTCAGVTIYTAIKKANLKPGQIIAISGLGALGHLGVQMAKAMGLKVVGIDARPEPIEMIRAFKLAPDLILDASKTSAEEAVKRIVELREVGYEGWDGADAVILTADPLESQRYGLDIVRRHGLVVVVAQPPEIKFEFKDFIFRDLTIVGSLHGNTQDLKDTIDLCTKNGIKSEVKTFKIEEGLEMLRSVHEDNRKGKSVLVFWSLSDST